MIYASQPQRTVAILYSVPRAFADSSKRAMRLHAAPMSHDEKPKAKRPVASTDALSCTHTLESVAAGTVVTSVKRSARGACRSLIYQQHLSPTKRTHLLQIPH